MINHLLKLNTALRIFIVSVIIPTCIAGFYYAFIASDIYVAEAHYSIRSNAETPAAGILGSMISGGESTASEDTLIVRDYILSRDMLEELDSLLDLRRHYSMDKIDFITRMEPDISVEDFIGYYQDMTSIEIDSAANVTTLKVRAFTAEKAEETAKNIISLSEKLVNDISERIIEDTLKYAKSEVDEAEARVRAASDELTRFRSETRSIDPGQETSAVLGIVTKLETELAAAKAELGHTLSFMSSDSPQVKTLGHKVKALEKQVRDERKRLTSEGTGQDYTTLIDFYEPLKLEQELAKELYTSALTSLELARANAQRKQRYLLPFVQPKTPDEAIEPERMRAVVIIFLILCIVYAIGSLVWAALKDHMRM